MTAPAAVRSPRGARAPEDAARAAERRAERRAVLRGLRATPRTVATRWFYDDAGAALFERICELPEYYVTRAELAILRARAGEIAARLGPRAALVEYGSGAGVKVRLLLDALDAPAAYVPVDVSAAQLRRVAAEVGAAYPGLAVRPVCADFTRPLHLALPAGGARPAAFFPGSTIGNFHPPEAARFLRRVARTVGPGGALLLGVDRRKARATLEAAYDDAAGVTAAFNRNALAHLNRALGADFDPDAFAHHACWNAAAGRVEMHLVSRRAQVVRLGRARLALGAGERIWTESSYKYGRDGLEALAAAGGFHVEALWTDSDARFWVTLLRARRGRAVTRAARTGC